MAKVRIAVPPGVGDVYWCLTKLEDFRKQHGFNHVTLCVQKTSLPRALAWAELCPLVNASYEIKFVETQAMRRGFAQDLKQADFVFWPNAYVDDGKHLREWMPRYAYDDRVQINTEITRPAGDVVIFPAHLGLNRTWLKDQPANFWERLIYRLEQLFGQRVVMIGSEWDRTHCDRFTPNVEYLVAQTSLAQVAGILERARIVVAVASGMAILANRFRTPCVAFFPDKHHPKFPWTWVPDDAPYRVFWNRELEDVEAIAQAAFEISRGTSWLSQHSSEN